MKCERSFKRVLITRWGMDELHNGKSYNSVLLEMKRLNRLTVDEIKKIRAEQKGK
jgi:hypothetical protein